jgi:hypothetical protein
MFLDNKNAEIYGASGSVGGAVLDWRMSTSPVVR